MEGSVPPSAQPNGVRLSLGDTADKMVVTWSSQLASEESCVQYQVVAVPPLPTGRSVPSSSGSGAGSTAAEPEQQQQQQQRQGRLFVGPLLPAASSLGTASRRLRAATAAAASSAAVLTVCGSSLPFTEPETGVPSQHVHRVLLTGLPPGQAVRYRCGSEAGGWSDWRVFTALRAAAQFSSDAPARLLIVGDMGLYNSRCWPDIAAEVVAGADPGFEPGANLPNAGGAKQPGGAAGGGTAAAAASVAAGGDSAAGVGAAGGGGYDALLHVGDLAYDLASLQGRRAARYVRMVEPAASRLPYMVAPGNHEWHANFSHYRALFSMPHRQQGSNLFYSFDVGPLHVLLYNTEVFFWPDLFGKAQQRAQHEWMEADLRAANANRASTPWILAAGHRPMYCVQALSGGRCNAEHEASRLGLPSFCPHNNPQACRPLHPPGAPGSGPSFPVEHLFYRYGVDVAVYGHVHDYERFWPVFNHTLPSPPGLGGLSFGRYINPRATVHVTSGAGGNGEMRGGAEAPPQGRCEDSAPWCAFQSGYAPAPTQSYDYSYSRLAVHNATHLHWQQVSSLQGRVVDDWWVVQSRHGPFG